MKNLIVLILFICAVSCNKPGAGASGTPVDLTGFEKVGVKGTDTDYVVLKQPNGNLLAEGIVNDSVQNGIWIVYFEEEEGTRIKSISNFVNGKLNGPHIEMNNRSQLEKRINYLNDQIHGLYAEYKFGRPLLEYNYNMGILDGPSREFSDRGKLIKESNYQNGKLHGFFRQYDEDGKVLLEYEYKNGLCLLISTKTKCGFL